MSKRRRRGPKVAALEQVASRAASVRADYVPTSRRRREDPFELGTRHRHLRVTPEQRVRLSDAAKDVLRVPKRRQLALSIATLQQRQATVRALAEARGRPVGRRTREKLKGLVPEALREVICAPTRKRRQVMFAQGSAGKGRRHAAMQPRKQRRSC